MSQPAPIRFHLLHPFGFPHRRQLKYLLHCLIEKEKTALQSLDYIFCNDVYLLQINRDFLHHDYLTDIISFDLSEAGNPVTGEIYISVERVKENARTFKQAFLKEMHRVIIHGALHLCGYGDKSKSEIQTMRAREEYYLELLYRSLR